MGKEKPDVDYTEKTFLEISRLIKNSSYLAPEIINCVNVITKSLKKGKKNNTFW